WSDGATRHQSHRGKALVSRAVVDGDDLGDDVLAKDARERFADRFLGVAIGEKHRYHLGETDPNLTRVGPQSKIGATATLTGNIARIIVADAVAHGHAEDEIVERFDIPYEAFRDVDARVPANVLLRLWEGMPKLLADDAYGVHLGERAASTSMPLVARLFSASATVG